MSNKSAPKEYTGLLKEIKERIRTAQYAALKAVNKQLVLLYWDIGRIIVKKQKDSIWGNAIVELLSKDLQSEFPGIKGFSAPNLWRMRMFYQAYAKNPKLSPLVIEIILCKTKDNTIVEYALKDTSRPIGVAPYRIVSKLPRELRKELPSPEQISRLLDRTEE
ncbi:MAG: PDDEXK nuclease domain-containing protein [Nanoarchaeota archaeon]|nr:PDDEXK nuclease domain-containing protein [Nanoarchaeota archaeon]